MIEAPELARSLAIDLCVDPDENADSVDQEYVFLIDDWVVAIFSLSNGPITPYEAVDLARGAIWILIDPAVSWPRPMAKVNITVIGREGRRPEAMVGSSVSFLDPAMGECSAISADLAIDREFITLAREVFSRRQKTLLLNVGLIRRSDHRR